MTDFSRAPTEPAPVTDDASVAALEPGRMTLEPPGPGDVLDGTYGVVEILGEGGMGLVLHARDLRLDRFVALKVVRPSLLTKPGARDRFLAEARALARVKHRNVVDVYAFGETRGAPYLVMEYVPGRTLAQLIDEDLLDRRPLAERLAILGQICDGLAAIHAAGVTHGDLKPSNVLVSRGGRIVLLDMGLARLLARSDEGGASWGTPDYAAPELTRGDRLPAYLLPRADIYALGCVAYELITGRLPFVAASPVELVRMHETVDPRPPSELRPGVPMQLDRVILKALAKDPERRIPTANDFRAAVHRAVRLSNLSRSRILIADDNADHRELLSELFARSFPGTTIEAVSDGLAAFDAIERQLPTLAVIDLDMPRMNGMELTAALRGRAETRSLPVIVLTGVGRGADWETLRSLGVTRFVVKPAIPQQLLSIVRDIIEPETASPRR